MGNNHKMKVIAIIPARYASQRLVGKALIELGSIPIFVRVWQNVSKSKLLSRAIIATDDERIAKVAEEYSVPYIMTSLEHLSGTDRIYEAYTKLDDDYDIIVNVQGDEPFLMAEDLDLLISSFDFANYSVATFVSKINTESDLFNPNCVKVARSKNGNALYFSRSTIPYYRDLEQNQWLNGNDYWKHIGVYAYTLSALKAFVALEQSNLEKVEKLEQLRLLENGYKFQCVELDKELIGIDTAEDLAKAEERLGRL